MVKSVYSNNNVVMATWERDNLEKKKKWDTRLNVLSLSLEATEAGGRKSRRWVIIGYQSICKNMLR